ncbi:MAG: hypothetical protein JO246_07165 [Frankiaceae bacterium]|nr:hypothetical protein [Frankiaceae bacterium]MBV9871240.1 hypothetical protein [Frankiaceae bacterium]
MRISKALAIGGTAVALTGAVALPAAAVNHHPASKGTFKSSVSPNPVSPGQTLTLKAHGAKKKTNYTCVLIISHGKNYAIGHILGAKTSNKHGKFKCTTTFAAYSGTDQKGVTRHCPTTKKDRKAGFSCGFAASTTDQKSNTVSYFKATK